MGEILLTSNDMAGFRRYSVTNPWIDFVVLVPREYALTAMTAIDEAMGAFWDEEYECYGDSVEAALIGLHIPYVIVYHDSEDTSDAYEEMWERTIGTLPYKLI